MFTIGYLTACLSFKNKEKHPVDILLGVDNIDEFVCLTMLQTIDVAKPICQLEVNYLHSNLLAMMIDPKTENHSEMSLGPFDFRFTNEGKNETTKIAIGRTSNSIFFRGKDVLFTLDIPNPGDRYALAFAIDHYGQIGEIEARDAEVV